MQSKPNKKCAIIVSVMIDVALDIYTQSWPKITVYSLRL